MVLSPLRFVAIVAIFSLCLSGGRVVADYMPVQVKVPEPRREFRAAWIATVHNLDWPSTYTLTPQQQRAEMIAILDLAAETGINAVIFQVRTECDAFYKSSLEPWSFFSPEKWASRHPMDTIRSLSRSRKLTNGESSCMPGSIPSAPAPRSAPQVVGAYH